VIKRFFKSLSGKIWAIVSALLIVVAIVANILVNSVLYDLLCLVFGGSTPIYQDGITSMYVPETKSKTEAYNNAAQTNIEVCEEGFVLLKNENNALPIQKDSKVTIFGKNSVDLAYGGSGSGSFSIEKDSALYKRLAGKGIDLDYKTIYDALENYYTLNPKIKAFYENDKLSGDKRSNANTDLDTGDDKAFTVGETPRANYTDEVKNSYQDYNDLAIVVITRIGGEGADLPRHQGKSAGAVSEDSHYLELDQNEIDMLTDVCNAGFKKVVVLFNIPSAMEANFLYDTEKYPFADKIDSALWIGFTGRQGIMALGDVMTGKISPSGKTVDTWATDFLATPSSVNFGTGIDQKTVAKNQTADQYNEGLYYFVNYEEGIYVGYRYFETRGYTDGEDWYNENVVYPFGYGLSYNTYQWDVGEASSNVITKDGTIDIEVEVENKGEIEGKDVVQVYVSAPYTEGGIEKSHKTLVGFAKTKTIRKGESDTVTISIDPYDFASYDYRDANKNGFSGYELEKGEYTFYVSTDAHHSVKEFKCTLASDIRYEKDPVTGNVVGNRYTKENSVTKTDLSNVSDSDARLDKILSRSDWEGTWPTANTDQDRAAGASLVAELKNTNTNNPNNYAEDWEYPDFEEEATITVRDLLPSETPEETYKAIVSYDDERWEQILIACNATNLIDVYNHGAYKSKEIEGTGMPETVQADGPSGFTCFMNKEIVSGTNQYCSEPVFASTWNVELIEKLGKALGEEGLWGYDQSGQPYTSIYAPGVNIHRSQFGGRCSEYFAEDPFLTGKMAASEIRGMQSKGLLPMMKHFVGNEQETHRSVTGDCSWMTEQSLREIYLKSFEIAVKESECRGIMTSFNRIGSMWTGGDYRLCTEILREEWGFRGCVICDFNTVPQYMNGNQMAYAGGDINLQTVGGGTFDCDPSETGDAVILLQAAKDIMYALVNTNAMNGVIIGWIAPSWPKLVIVADIAVAAIIVLWGVAVFVHCAKKEE
jgi:beta-glucosidase